MKARRAKQRRHIRGLSAFVDDSLLPGVCGASGSLHLLNFSHWRQECSQHASDGSKLCYRVDGDDHNDAEPWQEIEKITFERWITSPHNCNRQRTVEAAAACRAHADVVVVASPLAHCRADQNGLRIYDTWNPAMIDGRRDVHRAYWAALRKREEASATRPLILIQYDGTWQMEHSYELYMCTPGRVYI